MGKVTTSSKHEKVALLCQFRKVAKMTGIFVQFSFLEYDESFLGASYYVLAAAAAEGLKHPGSTHNYLLMAGNLHQVGK